MSKFGLLRAEARACTRARIGVAAALMCAFACAKDPVAREPELVLIPEPEEIAIGQQASLDVGTSVGLYDDPELEAYVGRVGQRVAAASPRPHLPWQFQIIDSPVVNAFALPGGPIYVTRGILAYLSSEAALAGVLGHEIGHVVARHHVEQISIQQLAGLGLDSGAIFFPEARPFGDVFGGGVGLFFLKFGRDAERESDRLGAHFSMAQGYDPTEWARLFSVLGRLPQSRRDIPFWASTHPDPAEREANILALVAERALGVGGDLESRRESYLNAIEGLVVGENPRSGFTCGRRFLHPDLELQVSFPDGWNVRRTKTAVYAASPDGGAAIQWTASPVATGTSAPAYARDFFRRHRVEYGTGERVRAGAFSAYRAPFRALTATGEIYGVAGFVADAGRVHEVIGLTRAPAIRRHTPTFHDVIESFDRLRDRTALEVEPRRIHLYRVPRTSSLRDALGKADVAENELEELSLLNGTALDAEVRAGETIKLVKRGTP